jgi:hypothetical protein
MVNAAVPRAKSVNGLTRRPPKVEEAGSDHTTFNPANIDRQVGSGKTVHDGSERGQNRTFRKIPAEM